MKIANTFRYFDEFNRMLVSYEEEIILAYNLDLEGGSKYL